MIGGRTPDPIVASRVVRVGPCSGILVSSDVVLTSAHCLAFSPGEVRWRNTRRDDDAGAPILPTDDVIGLLDCAPHPAYVEGSAAHDLATCRLARSVPLAALSLEERVIAPGSAVMMAGYGRGDPSEASDPTLRQVDTSVTGVREGSLVVGTTDRTACNGDSGGPVFTIAGASLRLVAIVRGTTEATCKSGADTVALASHRAWYERTRSGVGLSECAGPCE